ncbi:hypothetical protein H5410_064424 [Solanum commersonii]|uniref:Uncharacterized protein n=1 Tax=Solanum commersonii TaxID=4109 RepID=A0A9J5VZE0_SOLCO|nr:hypothetical protein H5410_064424 [Solanum commersonii]
MKMPSIVFPNDLGLFTFLDLINKVLQITGWHTKLLNYGGRAILVKHCCPKTDPEHHGALLWGWRNEKKNTTRASWKNLSFPMMRGAGMRNLKDPSIVKGLILLVKMGYGESLTWKHMMHNKHKIEEHIHWKLNSCNCSFGGTIGLESDLSAHQSTGKNVFNRIIRRILARGTMELEHAPATSP